MITLSSCTSRITDDLAAFRSNIVNTSTNKMILIEPERPYKYNHCNINNKIIVYKDSIHCSPCFLKTIYQWSDYIETLEQKGLSSNLIFIFNLSSIRIKVQPLQVRIGINHRLVVHLQLYMYLCHVQLCAKVWSIYVLLILLIVVKITHHLQKTHSANLMRNYCLLK